MRELAREIKSILLQKKINRCTDVPSLADFQVSLERAGGHTFSSACHFALQFSSVRQSFLRTAAARSRNA